MSAAVPDDMMAIVIPMLYAVTTHCRPASPTLKSDWMAGNATFTINASRKIMKRPRLVAARVKRCVLFIRRSINLLRFVPLGTAYLGREPTSILDSSGTMRWQGTELNANAYRSHMTYSFLQK